MCFQREYNMFGTEESYFRQLPKQLQTKCERLANCMSSVGLQPIMPEGGYFMMMDISNVSEYYIELFVRRSSNNASRKDMSRHNPEHVQDYNTRFEHSSKNWLFWYTFLIAKAIRMTHGQSDSSTCRYSHVKK